MHHSVAYDILCVKLGVRVFPFNERDMGMADAQEWKPTKWMHIPCLPKPEYHLMQAMIHRYGCKDQSELIAVLLRVVYDCIDDATLLEALDAIRCLPVVERRYDLTLE